jgi:hypothetical protein
MPYKPIKERRPCPRCGGTYTVNEGNGKLRQHLDNYGGTCSQEPLKRNAVSAASATRGATRVSSTLNDMDLSPAMVKALHYYAAPLAVRDRVPQSVYIPSMRTRRALLERELIESRSSVDPTRLTKEGERVAAKIEPLEGTPRVVAEHWHASRTLASEPAPSNVVVPSLTRLMDQIARYGQMCARHGGINANGAVDALVGIRSVLAILYREAGR